MSSALAPADVLRRVAGEGAVVLTGGWAGSPPGGALVALDPIRVVQDADPFEALSRRDGDGVCGTADGPGAVVGGGWFGWVDFSGARSHWAYYPNLLRYDPLAGQWFDEALIGVVDGAELERRRRDLTARITSSGPPGPIEAAHLGRFTSTMTRAGYEAAVGAAIEHIQAGDIYQVNVCLRLSAPFTGSPAGLYARLVQRLAPRFGAYVETAGTAVASASPELFLCRTARTVRSSPIKGTRPRPKDHIGAEREARRLFESAKERAENVMIVDMVRNDLARVATTGSVRVSELLRLEPHPGVWHLVSDVTATLRADVSDADLARATFPPGSVTGTPKIRAAQLIEQLEPVARGIYTGAIGFQSPVAGLELSVAIRTLEIAGGMAHLGVGAGITADSEPSQEWWECFDKADPIVTALGATIDVAQTVRAADEQAND